MPLFRKIFLSFIILLVLSFSVLYLVRNSIFNYYLSRKLNGFEEKYNYQINTGKATLEGISTVKIENLTIIPPAPHDTLITLREFKTRIYLLPLLKGKVRIKSVELSDGLINLVKRDSTYNFSFLLKKGKSDEPSGKKGYAKVLDRLINIFFDFVPGNTSISNVSIAFRSNHLNETFTVPAFTIEHNNLKGSISSVEKPEVQWKFTGQFNQLSETFNVIIAGKKENHIPFLPELLSLETGFDTIRVALEKKEFDAPQLFLKGNFDVKGFYAEHPRLDSNALEISKGNFYYNIEMGDDYVTLRPSSGLLNDIFVNLNGSLQDKADNRYQLNAEIPFMSAQKFFSSLPKGLFTNFEGLEVDGEVSFKAAFDLDMALPDSVKFDCDLVSRNFKIRKYGVTDFSKMNGPFLYTAYEKGKPVKTFPVGPEYPYFTPITEVSDYLKNAILISEDGSFFWHKGFRADAFRKAMAENIKKRKFARGGSTISMQLVKNVFLSRRKTIARKVEEAIIVWLIEQNRLSSKERMYEVYLNIIEWGPGIYGAGEAAEFYFDKRPADLTIEESIFMASIIPKPKAFKYSFDEQGHLRPYLAGYFRKVSELMLRKEIISEEQKAAVVPDVTLTGPARSIVVKDTAAAEEPVEWLIEE
jgi:hypothetical protein